LTTISWGTWTTAGFELVRLTTAPSVTLEKRTVPVEGLPPVSVAGLNETDCRVGVVEGGGVLPPLPLPLAARAVGAARASRAAAESAAKQSRRLGSGRLNPVNTDASGAKPRSAAAAAALEAYRCRNLGRE
jgi:hypothetical protein